MEDCKMRDCEAEVASLDCDEDSKTPEVVLVSSEGTELRVKRSVIAQSVLVKTMLDGECDADKIPLPNVKFDMLVKVVEFLTHTATTTLDEIEKPIKSSDMKEIVSAWQADFIDLSRAEIFDVILAANYMDIQPLLDLACAKVASMLRGKTPEQIRVDFDIVNDFTPEEEERIREENKWAEET